jgi:hypothetical protein
MQFVIFYLHLMLHAYIPRFDVMDERRNILGSEWGLRLAHRALQSQLDAKYSAYTPAPRAGK